MHDVATQTLSRMFMCAYGICIRSAIMSKAMKHQPKQGDILTSKNQV